MSGRISVDDRAFDGSARRLRSAKGGLAALTGQLNDGLAGGAPPAVAGQVRGAVAAARGAVSGVSARLDSRAAELTRRAAFARIASGEGTMADFGAALKYGASRTPDGLAKVFGSKVAGPVEFKDLFGGAEAGLSKWATYWSKHTFRRNPGFGSGPNEISKRRAFFTNRGHWAAYRNELNNHKATVEKLRSTAKRLWAVSLAADALEVLTAKTGAKRSEKVGGVAGGFAAGKWLAKPFNKHAGKALAKTAAKVAVTTMGKRALATRTGAAVGAMVGGPVGAAVGAGIGFVAVSVASSSAGKWAGRQLAGAANSAANAAGDAAKGLVKKVKFW